MHPICVQKCAGIEELEREQRSPRCKLLSLRDVNF